MWIAIMSKTTVNLTQHVRCLCCDSNTGRHKYEARAVTTTPGRSYVLLDVTVMFPSDIQLSRLLATSQAYKKYFTDTLQIVPFKKLFKVKRNDVFQS
jgi:hypothetical protein